MLVVSCGCVVALIRVMRSLFRLTGGGVPTADADLFESTQPDPSSYHAALGYSCIVVTDKRANAELCGFQLQGSD